MYNGPKIDLKKINLHARRKKNKQTPIRLNLITAKESRKLVHFWCVSHWETIDLNFLLSQ